MAGASRSEPVRQFPTPILADLLLVETVSSVIATNDPVEAGTRFKGQSKEERDKWGEAVFLGQRAIEGDAVNVVRVWATPPVLQNLYNFSVDFSGDAIEAPIFSRRYLEPRDSYVANRPSPLSVYSGIFRVRLTAGGTKYRTNFAVTATGGGGSGFTGLAIVNPDGEVQHVVVVTEGTGYTSAPTIVFTAGTGADAAGVGVFQPQTCYLVSEKADPAPNEWNSLFLLVTRNYETLPGPELMTRGFDSETGARTAIVRKRTSDTGPLDALGTNVSIDGEDYILVDGVRDPGNSSVVGVESLFYTQVPPTRIERVDVTLQFPGLMQFITGWSIPRPSGFQIGGPFAGVNFNQTAHRTASKPATRTTSYSIGPSGSVPSTWTVTTPGAASRFFPIGQNTIHGAILLNEVETAGAQTIEDIPASTPDNYSPTDVLTIMARETVWKYPIYKLEVVTIQEQTP